MLFFGVVVWVCLEANRRRRLVRIGNVFGFARFPSRTNFFHNVTLSSWWCHLTLPDSYAVFATKLLRIEGISVGLMRHSDRDQGKLRFR